MSAIIRNPSAFDLIATFHAREHDRVWPDIADEQFAVGLENELGYHGHEIWNPTNEPLDENYAKDILVSSLQNEYERHWKKCGTITAETVEHCVNKEIKDLTERLKDALKIAARNAMGGN